jgi:hypothetical protein
MSGWRASVFGSWKPRSLDLPACKASCAFRQRADCNLAEVTASNSPTRPRVAYVAIYTNARGPIDTLQTAALMVGRSRTILSRICRQRGATDDSVLGGALTIVYGFLTLTPRSNPQQQKAFADVPGRHFPGRSLNVLPRDKGRARHGHVLRR